MAKALGDGSRPLAGIIPPRYSLSVALKSYDGLISWKNQATLHRPRPTVLPDANATIEPVGDGYGCYVVHGPLTANRTLTLTDNVNKNGMVVQIAVLDTSGFDYTIQRSTGPTALATRTGGDNALVYELYKTGNLWILSTYWWARVEDDT